MSEKRLRMDSYKVYWICDKCGERMQWNGIVLTSTPPKYDHICKNRHQVTLNQMYPYIDYVEVDENE